MELPRSHKALLFNDLDLLILYTFSDFVAKMTFRTRLKGVFRNVYQVRAGTASLHHNNTASLYHNNTASHKPRVFLHRQFFHAFHFEAGETKFLYHYSGKQINSITTKWKLFHYRQKMHRVEKQAVAVEKGTKVHDLLAHDACKFIMVEQIMHPDIFASIITKIPA
jgi:hypothetical protein